MDDDGVLAVLPFSVRFFGTSYSSAWVNANGALSFGWSVPYYPPFALDSADAPSLAPFHADVDARFGNGRIEYGNGVVNGRAAFGATWRDVGYYNDGYDKNNLFQVVLIDRSDLGAGNFDFEFNYGHIQWETAGSSGGILGIGGTSPARAGWYRGVPGPGNKLELAGSGVVGAFLDTGPAATRLVGNRLNSDVDGRYLFEWRESNAALVPEPGSLGLLAIGLSLGVVAVGGRRKNS